MKLASDFFNISIYFNIYANIIMIERYRTIKNLIIRNDNLISKKNLI